MRFLRRTSTGVHTYFGGEHVQQAFYDVCGFGSACAAVCVNRRCVGEDADDFAADIINLVWTYEHQPKEVCWDCGGECGQISAHVGVHGSLYAGYCAVSVSDYLPVADVVASVGGGEVVFLAFFGPLDRAPQGFGYGEGYDLFGVEVEFAAEAAAHIWGNYSYLVFRMACYEGKQQPN